jgi:hypothetical protein
MQCVRTLWPGQITHQQQHTLLQWKSKIKQLIPNVYQLQRKNTKGVYKMVLMAQRNLMHAGTVNRQHKKGQTAVKRKKQKKAEKKIQ